MFLALESFRGTTAFLVFQYSKNLCIICYIQLLRNGWLRSGVISKWAHLINHFDVVNKNIVPFISENIPFSITDPAFKLYCLYLFYYQ